LCEALCEAKSQQIGMTRFQSLLFLGGVVPAMLVLASCASDSDVLCSSDQSVGVVASAIAVGLYEFDETDGGSSLRLDVLTSIAQLDIVRDKSGDDLSSQAVLVKSQFETFLNVSDELEWNDLLMSSDVRIDAVVAQLNSDPGVFATTAVDSYIASECGAAMGVVPDGDSGLPTLPPPPMSAPTATEPPIEMLDVDKEARALGETVAALFGLTIESDVALCLGKTLSEVVDSSRVNSDPNEYVAQFQIAFDLCGVDFKI
jgi:hypothetical protein